MPNWQLHSSAPLCKLSFGKRDFNASSPQRLSKIWPCSCFQGVRSSCAQLRAQHMAGGVFPVKREEKKSSQHSVSSQRPFKSSGRFSSEVFFFFFTAREVLGFTSYMWQADSVMLHLPTLHQAKPIPEPVCCTSTGIDVTSPIHLTVISLQKM